MSRSAVVALVAAVGLLIALAVVGARHDWLRHHAHWEAAAIFGGGVLAAWCAALSIRRIVDPTLEMPILLWVVIGVFMIVMILGSKSGPDPNDPNNPSSPNYSTTPRSSSSGSPGMGLGWAITATVLSLAGYALAIVLLVGIGASAPAAAAAAATTTAAAQPAPRPAVPAPAEAPPPAPRRTVMDARDLGAAIDFVRMQLTDDRTAPSPGAQQLARYAAARASLADFAVAKNETSLELVEKDLSTERGKRLCVAGTLARIEKTTVEGTELFTARLVAKSGDALEVYAVGSTGALVKRNPARFCGAITGRLGDAAFAVGMFDLPENKRR